MNNRQPDFSRQSGRLQVYLESLTRVCDIDACDVARYQQKRLAEGASPKTANLEIGTLRAILKRYGVWALIQQDVRMLPTREDVGRGGRLQRRRSIRC